VFFIRFTGKYKERQITFFNDDAFIVNRPYCMACMKEMCIRKLCPLKFDTIVKILNEPEHYFVMMRNEFTEDNSVVLNVSPLDK